MLNNISRRELKLKSDLESLDFRYKKNLGNKSFYNVNKKAVVIVELPSPDIKKEAKEIKIKKQKSKIIKEQ